jgi:ribosomal protein S18 acetylase RimI-like enzyme
MSKKGVLHDIKYLYEVGPDDPERIRELVEVTGFFYAAEIDVAEELVRERLAKGGESGYHFVLAEFNGRLVAYTCYGPIACTASSNDLYWIAVHPDFQGMGHGKMLLKETERLIRQAGGTRVYAETSQRSQYASTRAFYEDRGYHQESLLPDFYGPGDGKVTYCKVLV